MKIKEKVVLSFDENEKSTDVFRAKLRYLLVANDMTQRDLADELGWAQTRIASSILGRVDTMVEGREIIAEYFGYSLGEMFSKEDFVIEQETTVDISRKVKTYYERRKEKERRCKSDFKSE